MTTPSDLGEPEKSPVWKQAVHLAFSHGGLFLIVVLYSMLGGALFELLEKQNEIEACMERRMEYIIMENQTLFSLLDVILTSPINSWASTRRISGVLHAFRNNSLLIGYDGSWCEGYGLESGPQHEWTFAGGLFFAVTVITTIGYGHISPKTAWGRVLCVTYAMIGIPLMLMFLTDIGDVLANVFRYMYSNVICCGCFKRRKGSHLLADEQCRQSILPQDSGKSKYIGHTSSTGVPNKVSSDSETTFTSDKPRVGSGYGGTVQRLVRNSVAPIGIPGTEGTALKQRSTNTPPIAPIPLHRTGTLMAVRPPSRDSLEEEEDYWDELRKVSVPLTVAMFIIGLYILGGAVLFKYWEGWDMTQASYFCFITLSTIGFGDVTPARDFRSPQANAQLIIGTIYSVFGMAILAMCFTLMQEEIMEKVTWLGLKLGIMEPENEAA